jgi:hypothetical protein
MPVGTPTKGEPNARTAGGDKPTPAAVDRQALIVGLNHDLAGEYQAVLMYTQYSAKLTGPYRRELRALFQAEIADEQGHAQFLADKIASLGGEPTTVPRGEPCRPAGGDAGAGTGGREAGDRGLRRAARPGGCRRRRRPAGAPGKPDRRRNPAQGGDRTRARRLGRALKSFTRYASRDRGVTCRRRESARDGVALPSRIVGGSGRCFT